MGKKLYFSFLLVFLFLITTVSAKTFFVENFNSSGTGSLDDAINLANTTAGIDTIDFLVGGGGTISVPAGGYNITDDLVIFGPGNEHVTISGNNSWRIFTVTSAVSNFEIYSLSMINGFEFSGAGGGAIIYSNPAGIMKVEDCLFQGNESTQDGGAIYFKGDFFWLYSSSFIDNKGLNGGHLFYEGTTGSSAEVVNCTFAATQAFIAGGNSNAAMSGGAIMGGNTGSMNVTNCTFFNNLAQNTGGGINSEASCFIYLKNNLFYLNNQSSGGTGREVNGPAVYSNGFNAFNSLVGGNSGFSPIGTDYAVAGGGPAQSWNPTNMPVDVQKVGRGQYIYRIPLESNIVDRGDQTVINAGGVLDDPDAVDVRFAPRSLDGDGTFGANIDIGSFEYSPFVVTSTITGSSISDVISNVNGATATVESPYFIEFNITGTGPFTSNNMDPPALYSGNVIIDGYTQPGAFEHFDEFEGNINIFFKGTSGLDFLKFSGGTYYEISGLAIGSYNLGINSNGANDVNLWGNYFGLGSTGDPITYPNTKGAFLAGGSNLKIGSNGSFGSEGRNVFAANYIGLELNSCSFGYVVSNWFGFLADGSSAAGNTESGLYLNGSSDLYIGGYNEEEGNFIGNNNHGIFSLSSSYNYFENNVIGLDIYFSASSPNNVGVRFEESSFNTFGSSFPFPEGGNIVVHSNNFGVEFHGVGSNGNYVYGNKIGLMPDGVSIGNNNVGVSIHSGANNNIIGGSSFNDVNFISGNTEGVKFETTAGFSNTVQFNAIGLDTSGLAAVANGKGITCKADSTKINQNYIAGNTNSGISLNANHCIINLNKLGVGIDDLTVLPNGSTGPSPTILIGSGDGNVIDQNIVANGLGKGVSITNSDSTLIKNNSIYDNNLDGIYVGGGDNNSIVSNLIYSNGGLGIDLGTNGPGGYGLVNQAISMPTISSVATCGGSVTVEGVFSDINFPSQNIKIQIFNNPPGFEDPTGYGEGNIFITELDVYTDASGYAAFSINVGTSIAINDFVSITATSYDPGYVNTERSTEFSAYSQCVGVTTSAININGASCFGNSDGSADASTTGATPLSWDWYTSTDTYLGSGASWGAFLAGDYYVVANLSGGCKDTSAVFSIIAPPDIIQTTTSIDETCPGSNDGSVTTNVSGGTPGYVLQWYDSGSNPVGSTNTVSGLLPDTYYCLVTDVNGCNNSSPTVTINPGSAPGGSVSAVHETCPGYSDGQLVVTIFGGTPPWQISTDAGSTFSAASALTTQTASSLAPGTYQVGIQDANGCYTDMSFFTINSDPRTVSFSTAPASLQGCVNDNFTFSDGSVGWGSPSYLWDFGDATTDNSGPNVPHIYTFAGSFAVNLTVSDVSCTMSNSTIVSINEVISSISETSPISCSGAADGQLTANVTAGVGPYMYNWSTGGTTSVISGLMQGTYTLDVIDQSTGCSALTTNYSLIEPSLISIVQPSGTDVTCFLNADGTASISTPTGGTSPYIYQWFDSAGPTSIIGETTLTATGLDGGTFYCEVTDANGCIVNSPTVTIIEPSAISLNPPVGTNPTCNGSLTGFISLDTPIGGTSPYTFQWYNASGPTVMAGQTGQVITGIGAGTYYCEVTDFNGCIINSSSATLTDPLGMVLSMSNNDVLCFGGADGDATVSVSGGTAPFTYLWDAAAGNQTSSTASGLSVGSYSVTVTDANSCTSGNSITVNEPATMLSITKTFNDITCFGMIDGAINVTTAGGTVPYVFDWDNDGTGDFDDTEDLSGLAAGAYNIVVMDANGCTVGGSDFISEPAALIVSGETGVNVTCNGAADGSASIATPSGGTSPYTFQWYDNSGPLLLTGENSLTYAGSSGGDYFCEVTDANGCQVVSSLITVSVPAAFFITTTNFEDTCSNSVGEIQISISGSTAPYAYSVDGGVTFQGSPIFSNLTANTYNIVVQDNGACTESTSASLNDYVPTLSFSSTLADDTCSASLGQIAIVGESGGTAPYTYSFDGGTTFAAASNLGVLPSGTYSLQIRDVNLCESNFISVTLNDFSPTIIPSITLIDDTCNSGVGQIIVNTVSGGSSPYQYSIDGGTVYAASNIFPGLVTATYSLIVKDANGCLSTTTNPVIGNYGGPVITLDGILDVKCFGGNDGEIAITVSGGNTPYSFSWNAGLYATEDLVGLSQGIYDVTVNDASGCIATLNGTVVNEPIDSVVVVPIVMDVSCNGLTDGGITLSATGGAGSYNYSIDNGTSFQVSGAYTNQSAGSYNVQAMDGLGCLSAVQTVGINEPSILTVSSWSVTNVTCFGLTDGSVTAQGATGGTQPYSYQWYDNGTTSPLSGQIDTTALGVPAGVYYLGAVDNNGCTAQTASVTVLEPAEIVVSNTAVVDPLCFGNNDGSSTIAVSSGGTAPYQYSNDGGVTFIAGATSQTFSAMGAGTYSMVVKDANGCLSIPFDVILIDPAAVVLSLTVTDETCFGAGDGQVEESVTGGAGFPYDISRNGGAFFAMGSNPQTFAGLSDGYVHYVVAQDANGCSDTATVTVFGPAQISFTVVGVMDTCSLGVGEVQFSNVTGGSGVYGFSIDNGNTYTLQPLITDVSAGSYIAAVGDNNGCGQGQSVVVGDTIGAIPDGLAGVNNEYFVCPGFSIDIEAFGGDSYAWLNTGTTDTTAAIQGVTPDSSMYYYVQIILGACTSIDSTVVYLDETLNCDEFDQVTTNVFSPDNDGVNDVFVIGIDHLLDGNENTVKIFNRWGDEINNYANYNNADIAWDGTNQSGELVSNGTYFYVVEIPSINYSASGWVQVIR